MIGLVLAFAAAMTTGAGSPAPGFVQGGFVAAASALTGSSGEQIFTGAQIKEMGGTVPKLLSSPKKPDVSALHRQGIQGEMVYAGYVGSDGRMHDIVIEKSSRSEDLDAVGLDLVKQSIFTPAANASGAPIAARVVYPVYLWKDSMMDPNFGKKSCADFVADADWHGQAFPEEAADKLRGWLLVQGMLFAGRYNNASVPQKTLTFEEAYARCKASPDRRFLDILLKSK